MIISSDKPCGPTMNAFVPAASIASSTRELAAPLSSENDYLLHSAKTQVPSLSVAASTARIAVVSTNNFFRTCLSRCLKEIGVEFDIRSYNTIDEWSDNTGSDTPKIVLLCATGQKATETVVQQDLQAALQAANNVRVIIVSDFDRPDLMISALEKGARGFAPMNLDLEVFIGAIKLVNVGGTFVPVTSLMSMRSAPTPNVAATPDAPGAGMFTQRQFEVLNYLRIGDPNKIIAYKMSMSEATVKIHVRNMMRKIKANNRTELVCKSNALLCAA
ncbi:LuxR C-terminal-related transcriptional regulator [Labrys okinawensis]|uniref:LuxR C-terminal-related transcriptional regulator n=1 Tax=Labrys okinawensis TaxID=346911 RepID=UPI0039BD4470